MKRYSITTPSQRRRSMKLASEDDDPPPSRDQIEELERLEQETTLVLQDIDRNLARANAILNNRILPKVKGYAQECNRVWSNVGFWKHFFEQSANVVLDTNNVDPVRSDPSLPNPHMFKDTMQLSAGRVDLAQDSMQSLLMELIPIQTSPGRSQPAKRPISQLAASAVVDSTPTWSMNQVNNRYLSSTPQPPVSKDQSHLNMGTMNDDSTGSLNMPPLVSEAVSKALSSPARVASLIDHPPARTNQTENFLSPQRAPGDTLIESSPSFPLKPVLVSDYRLHDDEEDQGDKPDSKQHEIYERSFSPPPQLTLTIHNISPPAEAQPGSSPTKNSDGSFSPISLPSNLSPAKRADTVSKIIEAEAPVPTLLSEYVIPQLQTDQDPEILNSKRQAENPPSASKRSRRAFDVANEGDNVFIEESSQFEKSAIETTFRSVQDQGHESVNADVSQETSESLSRSRSMSRLFDAAVLNASKDMSDKPMSEARNLFSNLSESFAEQSNADRTGDSTNDLLPEYREKFRQLTESYGKKS